MLKSLFETLGVFFLSRAYEAEEDELGKFDNTRDKCPACGIMASPCIQASCGGMTHDPCLGHIARATSACCGHGISMGHVDIDNITGR